MNTEYLFPMLLARKGGGGMPGINYAVALSVTVEGDQYTFQLMDQNGDPIGDPQIITLPAAMVFRGTVGTGGTIPTLPVDGTAAIGDTYMVYADGTYASQAAVVGDTFVCLTKTENANTWAYIPSGNDPRVTSVTAGTGLTTSDGKPITSTGTVKAKLQSDTAFGAAAATISTPGSVTTDIQPVLTDSNGNLAVKVTKSDIGLGNVTNDAQVKKISSSVQNNIVTWGAATGDTVADSGVAIEISSSGISDSDAKVPTSKSIKTNVSSNAVLTGYTPGTSTSRQSIAATDTIQGAINKLENNASLDEAKTDRIKMDSSETQNYYMQNSTPSNPVNGDYWFNDDPIISSDITAMTGYAKASAASAISTSDTLNAAVGKLEYKADSNATGLATKQNQVLGSWTPGTATAHSTPAGTDTVLQALQKIDNNQRNDETNISSLQGGLTDGTFYSDYIHGNLFVYATNKITGKYYWYDSNTNKITTTTSSSYDGFILKVDKNTTYTCNTARFLLYLRSDKTTVFDNAQNVTSFNSGDADYIAISFNKTSFPDYIISKGNSLENGEITYEIPWLYSSKNYYNGVFNENTSDITIGQTKGFATTWNVEKNYVMECSLTFDTFGDVEIGKGMGTNYYYGSSVEITDTEYIIYNYTSGGKTEVARANHGLTISNYLTVFIICLSEGTADITITTSTGSITIDDVSWTGYSGNFAVKSISGTYTNPKLRYRMLDYNKNISVYGDSYISYLNDARWTYYIKNMGFDAWLLNGFPGASSSGALIAFKSIINNSNPKYVLWAIGMNDGSDTDTYPTAWKNAIDEVIEICENKGITLVLTTIPCVPNINHAYKNAYVKSTGLRYIDFAKAVGAETAGSTWYSGLLSSDNVHPTVTGAKVLAQQALIDMPEIAELP